MRVVGPSVALGDLLALEALRLFVPQSFAKVPALVGQLTGEGFGVRPDDSAADPIEILAVAAGPQAAAVRQLASRLFPAAARSEGTPTPAPWPWPWPQSGARAAPLDTSVANPEVLRTYLSLVLHMGGETRTTAALVASSLPDTEAFHEKLASLDGDVLCEVLERLAISGEQNECGDVQLAVEALLDARERLPEAADGTFAVAPEAKLRQIVRRLVGQTPEDSFRTRPDLAERLRGAGITEAPSAEPGRP